VPDRIAWIDGWEVRERPDGSFGVYDDHGMIAGPFGNKYAAIAAAAQLPKPRGSVAGVAAKQTPDPRSCEVAILRRSAKKAKPHLEVD
jgi:hypothetical protein